MHLKKVNQNTSKLFCALFMLGMNVYGVDRQGNGNGQPSTPSNEHFNTEHNEGDYFDSLLTLALEGSIEARNDIKILTRKDSGTQPTLSMWYGACNKAIRATMQGNKHGLDIFKYLTSDECHMASKTLGSYFLKYIMDDTVDIARSEKHNALKSPAHDLSFAILRYLTSPDCKVRPSQEAVDQLFREKELIKALEGSDAAMDTIKILTSKDSNIQPTIEMWRDACNTAIRSTLQGNSYGLNIFKYLTSDACHTKSNAMGSDIWELMVKSEIAGSDFLPPIMNGTVNIANIEQNNGSKSLAHDLSFAILTYLTSPDCEVRPSQTAVDQLFREKALIKALEGSDAAMDTIKILTSKDSNIQPTLTMWDKACDTAIHATLQGNSYGLDIFKYLTSDACHHKREELVPALFNLILNFTAACAEKEQSNPVQTFESKRQLEIKEYKDRSFSILTYLTSPDCKVPPSQEAVDKLFREKVKQYLEMKNESFGPSYVIKYLTSDYCSVRPSQKEVDSFFGQLINTYTKMKSSGLDVSERTTNLLCDAIIHLISNKCSRHPKQKTVRASIEALTQANLKRRSELTNNLVRLNGKNNTDLGEIEKCGMHLQNTELRDLKERFEEYLKNLPEAVGNISEAESKTVNKSEAVDVAINSKLKNNNYDPQDQFTI